jgi:hypothetical protein
MKYVASAALAIICLATTATMAFAQEGGQREPTILEIRVQLAPTPELSDYAVATLRTGDGQPIGNAVVDLAVFVDFMGGRFATLGSGVTDVTGVALVPITPRSTEHRLRARFTGDETHAPSEAVADVRFPDESVVPVRTDSGPSQLDTLRRVVPRVMGIIVVFFAFAMAYVVRAVRRGGRSGPTDQGDRTLLGKGAV